MKRQIIGLNRVGSFYNFPNWRYQVYLNPGKANLAWCTRKLVSGAGALKRYTAAPEFRESTEVNNTFPQSFQRVVKRLEGKKHELFYKLFKEHLKKEGEQPVFCRAVSATHSFWNMTHVDALSDPFLQRLLRHASHVIYDPYIQFAVGLKLSKEHAYIFKSIGYHIFAGVSDQEVAKRFRMYPKQIEAIRYLYFDFSHSPKDPAAQAAYFTQLVDNEIIADIDRRYFKLIAELGEVGLKAHANYHALTTDQRIKVDMYLGDTMLENVLGLNFAVTDMKDAINFNGVINNLASFYIKKEEVNYYRAKVRNLDATTTRIVRDNGSDAGIIDSDDREALKLIGTLALKENSLPEYKSITELNSFE